MSKTVLITGGAKGIGKAIAIDFLKEGYNVCITFNSSFEEAKELEKLGINIYNLDITSTPSINNVISDVINKFKKIDVLVNNAGICDYKLFTDITDEDFYNIINTNLSGTFKVIRSVLDKTMIHEKNGSIINISSIFGEKGGSMEVSYSASKAGINGLTKALAKELGLSNITVNAIAPGVIKTDMLNYLNDEDLNNLKENIALNRLGMPEDISKMALFLASDGARYITGQVINIDGGLII